MRVWKISVNGRNILGHVDLSLRLGRRKCEYEVMTCKNQWQKESCMKWVMQ